MSTESISAPEARKKIIQIYKDKVHDKKPDTSKMTKGHDGKKVTGWKTSWVLKEMQVTSLIFMDTR